MMTTLQGRVAVITGAASGIGQALAENLSVHGCHLALVDVDAEGLRATAKRLHSTEGRISLHHTDVSKKEQVELLPDEVLRQHEHVDILINNAGVALVGAFETYSIDDLEWIVGINLMGVIYGCAYFLPALRSQKKSHIVNISSDFGLIGFPTKSMYCATKFESQVYIRMTDMRAALCNFFKHSGHTRTIYNLATIERPSEIS